VGEKSKKAFPAVDKNLKSIDGILGYNLSSDMNGRKPFLKR